MPAPGLVGDSGQLERDGQRCAALEATTNATVYTVDTNWASDDVHVTPGRHCQAHVETWNSSISRNFRTKINQAFGGPMQFAMIGIDYYHFPLAYARTLLTPQFFRDALPGYAQTNFLLPGGVVWLPYFDFVEEALAQSAEIQNLYHIQITENPTEYPLYHASETIMNALQELPDGFDHNANCQIFFKLERK
jgi:hypothetical protein